MKKVFNEEIDILTDKNISLAAKGLFSIIFNKIAPFECTKKALISCCKDNEENILSSLAELVAFGYLGKDYLECYMGVYDKK